MRLLFGEVDCLGDGWGMMRHCAGRGGGKRAGAGEDRRSGGGDSFGEKAKGPTTIGPLQHEYLTL